MRDGRRADWAALVSNRRKQWTEHTLQKKGVDWQSVHGMEKGILEERGEGKG